jgi:RNA methyltransferase, TrmH family
MKELVSGIKHPAYRDALALTRAGGRTATGRYLVEDLDMVRQALAAPGATLYGVFATPDAASEVETACNARSVPLYILGGGLLTKLVGTGYETAVTAIAVVAQRIVPTEELLSYPDALILCGERIQDPRNVGVLIRTAEAAGCAGLLLSADSAEPFSRQAVRSTTGSVLRLPISLVPNLPAALNELRRRGATVAASSGQAAESAFQANLSVRPLVLVVGNEQHGITEELRASADRYVRLPMAPNGADSLNVTVAAGVLVYEALRQREQRGSPSGGVLPPGGVL